MPPSDLQPDRRREPEPDDPESVARAAGTMERLSKVETPLARRALRAAAVVEPLSLLVLLTNLVTVHLPAVAAATGPVHGTAYLVGIGATWAGGHSRRARLLAWVPGVGALLASRDSRRDDALSPRGQDSQVSHAGHPDGRDSPPPADQGPRRAPSPGTVGRP